MAKNHDNGRRWATIAIYGECQRNHSAVTGDHVVDGCLEFLGIGEHRKSEVALYCSKCGCHRTFHRKEEITILADPATVQMVHKLAALPPQQPRFPVPVVFIGDGEAKQEEDREPKRERAKFTETQKEAMRGYAERLGWRLRGHNEHRIFRFCLEIGVTLRNFKLWMRNNKRKYILRGN